jgi:subtilisin family serine protease
MSFCFVIMILDSKAAAQAQWGIDAVNWHEPNLGKSVTVAVIDTGVDIRHSGLKDRIWTNPGESGVDSNGKNKASNGIDDDGNGYIDDIHGWNFVENNPDLTDHHGHGTHIAGIIAAHGKVRGISVNSKVMVLRYFDNKKNVDLVSTTVKAMEYAIQNGAKIINYSAGGFLPNKLEEKVVKLALKNRVLIVAAAGNEGADTDVNGFFPASYKWPHILSVAAVNASQSLSKQSNYGSSTVNIAAPGDSILSLLPGEKYGLMSGTSQATAFVTGTAAEIISSSQSDIDPIQVVDRLVSSGTSLEQLKGRTTEATFLNVKRAWMSRSRGMSVAGYKINQ